MPASPTKLQTACTVTMASTWCRPSLGLVRLGSPMRRTKPNEGRHHVDAMVTVQAVCNFVGLAGIGNVLQAVAQPFDGGPGDEDRAFERVGAAAVESAGNCRQQP